ncbi:MAG: hypothetical protein ACREIA_23130 [Opitutaceae bacterium]
MKDIARYIGCVALGLVIVPPLAFMLQMMGDESLVKGLMLAGTIAWFVTAPIWMRPGGQ